MTSNVPDLDPLNVYEKKSYIDFVRKEFIFGEDIRFGKGERINHYVMGSRWIAQTPNRRLNVLQFWNPWQLSQIMKSIWNDMENIESEYKAINDEFDTVYFDNFFCCGAPKRKKRRRAPSLKKEWSFLNFAQNSPKKKFKSCNKHNKN